ncbi:unnamed protein product [Coffea canephora]|uniref:NAD(P)H-quinone oxidoreductase subunit S, chloroplastic n=1 Tax=Coffea canephora TaxID=49390 RepID=A0A068UUE8_COFCA|nr:unnamed protein product [Coffea canephora]
MASSFLQSPLLHNSSFLGHTSFTHKTSSNPTPKRASTIQFSPNAKFNLSEILGGRGLCNGEAGLQEELKKTVSLEPSKTTENEEKPQVSAVESVPEDGFEKELQGLTGGFPGGEKGLQKFIEQNPPPKKSQAEASAFLAYNQNFVKRQKPPQLPILLPGMIVIVKNPSNPYHMYCGIVQRITDGKAGVLFEGGNWDRLITFRLEELERREKGPPMVNPRSAILETMLDKN